MLIMRYSTKNVRLEEKHFIYIHVINTYVNMRCFIGLKIAPSVMKDWNHNITLRLYHRRGLSHSKHEKYLQVPQSHHDWASATAAKLCSHQQRL